MVNHLKLPDRDIDNSKERDSQVITEDSLNYEVKKHLIGAKYLTLDKRQCVSLSWNCQFQNTLILKLSRERRMRYETYRTMKLLKR